MKKAMLFGGIACVLSMFDTNGMDFLRAKEDTLNIMRKYATVPSIRECISHTEQTDEVSTLQTWIFLCADVVKDYEGASEDLANLERINEALTEASERGVSGPRRESSFAPAAPSAWGELAPPAREESPGFGAPRRAPGFAAAAPSAWGELAPLAREESPGFGVPRRESGLQQQQPEGAEFARLREETLRVVSRYKGANDLQQYTFCIENASDVADLLTYITLCIESIGDFGPNAKAGVDKLTEIKRKLDLWKASPGFGAPRRAPGLAAAAPSVWEESAPSASGESLFGSPRRAPGLAAEAPSARGGLALSASGESLFGSPRRVPGFAAAAPSAWGGLDPSASGESLFGSPRRVSGLAAAAPSAWGGLDPSASGESLFGSPRRDSGFAAAAPSVWGESAPSASGESLFGSPRRAPGFAAAAVANTAITPELRAEAEQAKQKAGQLLSAGKINERGYDHLVYGFNATFPERWKSAISFINMEYDREFPKSATPVSEDESSRSSSPELEDVVPEGIRSQITAFYKQREEIGTAYARYNNELPTSSWMAMDSVLSATTETKFEVMEAQMMQIAEQKGISGDLLSKALEAVRGERAMEALQRLYTLASEKGKCGDLVNTLLDGGSEEIGASRGKILYSFFSLFPEND